MIGSLFSGIGGLELGLERAGLGSVAWQVERSAFCRHVLAKHWPDAVRHDDVRTVGAHNLARVDVLCGGFPCQDLSTAGKGAGLAGERSGLWFEMQRIIDELRPTWVVVENIAHGWRRYLPVVRRAFWSLGYASLPLRVRACDVGARHERARVFVVAGTPADVDRVRELQQGGRVADLGRWDRDEADEDAAHTPGDRRGAWGPGRSGEPAGWAEPSDGAAADDARLGLALGLDVEGDGGGLVSPGFGLPPRPWMVRGVHGLPGWVDGARRSGWTAARVREARVHALGNAVVPACAEVVGRLIASVCVPTWREWSTVNLPNGGRWSDYARLAGHPEDANHPDGTPRLVSPVPFPSWVPDAVRTA